MRQLDELFEAREGIRMLGPKEVDDKADAVAVALTMYWIAHNAVLNAYVRGEPDDDAAWTQMADATDRATESRNEFVAAARSVMTDNPGSS